MISVPRVRRFDVDDYGLFPGPKAGPSGLHAKILDGLTLVVGANGLGKTTFVTMMFRVLSGPYDIPSLGAGEALGTRRLEHTAVPPSIRWDYELDGGLKLHEPNADPPQKIPASPKIDWPPTDTCRHRCHLSSYS